MHENRSMGEQIVSGLFTLLWVVALPFVGLYRLLKWFVTEVVKETGNKIVKVVGGAVAIAIIGYFVNLLSH